MSRPIFARGRESIADTLFGPPAVRSEPDGAVRIPPALSLGAIAIGAVAVGAIAVGALAIARLVIGRMSISRARIGELEIDELTIHRLRVIEDMPPIPDDPGIPTQDDVWDPS